jgi:myo-inositol-1(or 4)-monophosphatase
MSTAVCLDALTAILTTAGAEALAYFNALSDRSVDTKAPGDLVSDADRAVEATVRQLLARHFPGDGVLGEEMGGRPIGRFWAVDPIDGTSNFLSGLPFWTLSVGLMDQGQAIAGGIFAPALGLIAVADGTALRETGLARGSRPADPACVGLGRNARWPAIDRFATEAAIEAAGLSPRLFGSCALSLMFVATGRLKGYIEPRVGGLWDCAAGLALCRAARVPTAFKLHPDGTVDVLAGEVFAIAKAAGWHGEILEQS